MQARSHLNIRRCAQDHAAARPGRVRLARARRCRARPTNGIYTLTLCMAFAGFAAATSVVAADASNTPEPSTVMAWSERAIDRHIDQKDYAGQLDDNQLQTLVDAGAELFSARFKTLDGVGRPMSTQAIIPTKRKRPARNQFSRTAGLDANACASCHMQPLVGGAGDFAVNVFVSEGFQNTDFDNTDPQFSNERNTNHLMGAGLIELLAREMTRDLQQLRTRSLQAARQSGADVKVELASKGVHFGHLTALSDGSVDLTQVEGVDPDLTVRPFGQKGVMTSLRQFTINALNHHHGMLANERFGSRWTGSDDFDEDGVDLEISDGDVSALVAWQAVLSPPGVIEPDDQQWLLAAQSGETVFSRIGCAECHRPSLPLESTVFSDPGPDDAAGTRRAGEDAYGSRYDLSMLSWMENLERNEHGHVMVPLYGDLKRHRIADEEVSILGNELLSQRFVERDVFITAELWGVGSTDPYGHRGNLTSLDEVIRAHGGEARASRDAYMDLSETERQSVIAWLRTLHINKHARAVISAPATEDSRLQ